MTNLEGDTEIANIRWDQIDLDNRQIRLWRHKVQIEGLIFMTGRVFNIMVSRAYEARSDWVFTNRAGGPRGLAGRAIRNALKRAGLADCTNHLETFSGLGTGRFPLALYTHDTSTILVLIPT